MLSAQHQSLGYKLQQKSTGIE